VHTEAFVLTIHIEDPVFFVFPECYTTKTSILSHGYEYNRGIISSSNISSRVVARAKKPTGSSPIRMGTAKTFTNPFLVN
jgi:hypothetical protein